MGVIQGSINSLLGIAGVASGLYQSTPGFQKKVEAKKIASEQESLIARKQEYYKQMQGKSLSEAIQGAENLGYNKESEELAKRAAKAGVMPQAVAAEQLKQAKIASDVAAGVSSGKYSIKTYNAEQFMQDRAKQESDTAL